MQSIASGKLSAPRLALFVFLFAQIATASTFFVGTCHTGSFPTIQAAVNGVLPGSTISVCPGVYAEQVTINKSLTLNGISTGSPATATGAVVVLPTTVAVNAHDFDNGNSPIWAQIFIVGPGNDVAISNIVVDGNGNPATDCTHDLVGILIQNAQATLNHVTTRNQFLGAEGGPLSGCQDGEGIFAQANQGNWTVTVENSSVHDYQKNGITGNDPAITLVASNNYVVGQGPTNGAAENGIQIAFGATGTVTGNFVIDDVWAPDTITDTGDAASGILLFDPTGTPTVSKNMVGDTQFGIALVSLSSPGNTTITGNKVYGTRLFDGIDVCSNTNTVTSNTLVDSSESGIHLDATCGSTGNGNTVTGNTVMDACVGILSDAGTSGNTISPDTFYGTPQTTGASCTPAAASVRPPGATQGNGTHFRPAR